jgi:Dual specificity phosphatase, catalytic domain
MDANDLSRDPQTKIFQITEVIWQGPFASPKRHRALQAVGITPILNVGESASVLTAIKHGYREVVWHPIEDLEKIPFDTVIRCLDILHAWTSQPQSRVYVHCLAGWNRSPTIVWLYLVACGIPSDTAKQIIGNANYDAIPGHQKLVDTALIECAAEHGRSNYLPLTRAEIVAQPRTLDRL